MKTHWSSACLAVAVVAATLFLAACGSLPKTPSPNANNLGAFTVAAAAPFNNVTNAFVNGGINATVLVSTYSPAAANRLTANTGDFLILYNDGDINSSATVRAYDVWRGQLGAASGISVATYTYSVRATTTVSGNATTAVSITLAEISRVTTIGSRATVANISNTLSGLGYTVLATLTSGANRATVTVTSTAARGNYVITLASTTRINYGYARALQTVNTSVAMMTITNANSTVAYAATSFLTTLAATTQSSALAMTSGYRTNLYGSSDVNRFLVWADYAAIGLLLDTVIVDADAGVEERAFYMGALTPAAALPATTQTSLSYTIGEAWGVYSRDNAHDSELLRGNGNIVANFASGVLTLSLDVNTAFSNADVFNVNNVQLTLNRTLNQFNLLPAQRAATVIQYAPGYTDNLVNAANGTQTGGSGSISGSFFGPGGREVGGVLRHVHQDGEGRTDLGFIGKQ